MILAHTDLSLTVLMVLCMLCWGSWPVFLKLAKRYRFELFYFDFGFGLGITALILAFTLGSLGFDGFSFSDDIFNARKQEWLFAVLAAMIFNFGNMLTLAAASVAGLSVAFPIAIGVALVVSSWIAFLGHPAISTTLLAGGSVCILIAVVLGSSAYSHLRILQHEALARAGRTKSTRRPSSLKGVLLALVGGVVLGAYHPLLVRAQDPDDGVGPYALLFLFAVGVIGSTFVFNLFFMNLPVDGDPLEIAEYLKTPVKNHFLGLLGGAVFGIGAIAIFVANTPRGEVQIGAPLGPMLAGAAAILAALWGLVFLKEFKAGDSRAKAFSALTLLFFAAGLTFFSYAAASGR
jgi:glucose uptake protein